MTSLTKDYFDQKHQELMQLVANLEQGIDALRQENSQLRQENCVLKSELINIKKSCLQSELASKRQNLLLHGIPVVSGQSAETAVRELLTDIGLANADAIPFVKCYRLNSNRQKGASTRSSARNKIEPIIVTLTSITDKDDIMRNCGKLKGSRKSISCDLPRDLARRRKELLAYGYSLRTSAIPSVKVAETRVMSKGINIWLEAKKNSKVKNWTRVEDTCFDPFMISVSASNAVIPSRVNEE